MKIRVCAVILVLLVLVVALTGCFNEADYTKISLGSLVNASGTDVTDELKALNGKKVYILAYMSQDSPVTGEIVYLVSSPTSTCPFCNAKYADGMPAIYSNGKVIEYSRKLVRVYGTLEIKDVVEDFGGTAQTTPFRILIDKIDYNA